MKGRYLWFAIACIAFVAILVLVLQEDRVELKWRLEMGQTLRIRETDYSRSPGAPDTTITHEYEYTVARMAPDGTITFDAKTVSLKDAGLSPPLFENPEGPFRPWGPVQMRSNGERIYDSPPRSPELARLKDFALPDTAVAIGDSWSTRHSPEVFADLPREEWECRYTLSRVEDRQAFIEMETIYPRDNPSSDLGRFYVKSRRRTREGVFSLKRGLMLRWREEIAQILVTEKGEEKPSSGVREWLLLED